MRNIGPSLIIFGKLGNGIQEVELNLRELYRKDPRKLEEFEKKLTCFLDSDSFNSKVVHKEFLRDGVLKYETECIVPKEIDRSKVPLLLLLGNPASHSVFTGMPFAYEGKKYRREHRFWKALDKAEILSFRSTFDKSSIRERKEELQSGHCISPFHIGLATYYSMPSGASDKWGQVKGLYRLFGKEAMEEISKCEKGRIDGLIRDFMKSKGAVFAFQKEAYTRIRKHPNAPKRPSSNEGGVQEEDRCDVCECDPKVKLFCFPPTRNIQWKNTLKLLRFFKQRALET